MAQATVPDKPTEPCVNGVVLYWCLRCVDGVWTSTLELPPTTSGNSLGAFAEMVKSLPNAKKWTPEHILQLASTIHGTPCSGKCGEPK